MKEEFTTIYMSLIKIIWKETELKSAAHENMLYAGQSARIADKEGNTEDYIMHRSEQCYQMGKEAAYSEMRELLEKAMMEFKPTVEEMLEREGK